MYICVTVITIVQIPSQAFPARNKTLIFNFVAHYEANNAWENLTDKATVTLPKNIGYTDGCGKVVNLGNLNANMGGFSANDPIFLKGDSITINAGYKSFDKIGTPIIQMPPAGTYTFSGYISKVTSKKPIVLECENNMWKLKQVPAPNKMFPGATYTVESMLAELIQGTGFTVNQLTKTKIGDFRTQNETVCDVLARLRKEKFLESYFRGNQLRCGSMVYIETEAVQQSFSFQKNIISDELEYQRKDDIVLSAVAYSVNLVPVGGLTRDGNAKTQQQRLEVLITYQNGNFTSKVRPLGQKADFAPNQIGERKTYHYLNVTDPALLIKMAQASLMKYFYTGFRGKFTTFGMPYVRQGDNALIMDNVLPERNGIFKIKSVKYTGGREGLRQEVELDYMISKVDAKGNRI